MTPWASLPLLSGNTAFTAKDVGNLVDSLTYMDDIYLVGHSENMKTALQILEEDLSKLLLRINFTKSWSHKPITGLLRISRSILTLW